MWEPPAANGATTLGPALPVATPTTNLCVAGVACTYFNTLGGAGSPRQATPGVITRGAFSRAAQADPVRASRVTADHAGRVPRDRVERDRTTRERLATFATRLPIQSGDVIGVENSCSALIFTATLATTYFFSSALADGATGTPETSSLGAAVQLLANATVESDRRS